MAGLTEYVAATRLGLGAGVEETAAINASVTDWLQRQLTAPQVSGSAFAGLPPSAQQLQAVYSIRQERRRSRNEPSQQQKFTKIIKDIFLEEMQAKMMHAITTPTPFYERLVNFWSNHFSVSVRKATIRSVVGGYEREAIRPHVMGYFGDMLRAVTHHPAMLMYLDNAQSIGPESMQGSRYGKGLNENLAREIMELHTLGVDAGYTQTDVTNFAKVITGWGIGGPKHEHPGMFDFDQRRHNPGAQTIMGRVYADEGEQQGVKVLRDFVRYPATARHIATKLARHFIADLPPDSAVEALAKAFEQSGGHLPTLYRVLLSLPEVWDAQGYPRIKSSYDLVVSTARVTGCVENQQVEYYFKSLKFLGGAPFTADSPAGLPDAIRDMAGPEAIMRRVQWAQMAGRKLRPAHKAAEYAALAIGPVITQGTTQAILQAGDESEALAVLLGSPEFQRR